MSKAKIPDILKAMESGLSARKACEASKVPLRTFLDWVNADDALGVQYARARELGLEKMAEDILDIADDRIGDPQRDRLRVDARRWLLSKMLPKKYGDKLDVTSEGERIQAPPIVGLQVITKPDAG
jgi:hypothetical protein